MKRLLALISVLAVAAVLATTGSATQAGPRSGALYVTKECSQYNFKAGGFCTITSSNIEAIKPGMKVVYLSAPANNVLDSDIVLGYGHGSAAYGHVVLNFNLTPLQGQVTFTGGTGAFAGFNADTVVFVGPTGAWHWDGTYSFGAPGRD